MNPYLMIESKGVHALKIKHKNTPIIYTRRKAISN